MMRVVVIGRSGQLAHALAEQSGLHHAVQCVGRPQIDIAEGSSVDAMARLFDAYDVVVNAAAYTAVDKAESEPERAHLVNCVGARRVAKAAQAVRKPLIHISTDHVFSGASASPYSEDHPVDPIGVYGKTKLEGEYAVLSVHDAPVILRTAWVYSQFGSNFVKTMLRLGELRDEVSVVDDRCGNPTSANDLAEAVVIVARRMLAGYRCPMPGVINCVGTGEASWADLAEAVFDEARAFDRGPVTVRRIATADYPTPARWPANSRLNMTMFEETFGWEFPAWRKSVAAVVGQILAPVPVEA